MLKTDKEYWNSKYQANEIGWDIGYVSTPIKNYVDQLTDKNLEILIPGCGNAWEGEYLTDNGFINAHLIDISDEAVKRFKKRVPQFPVEKIYTENFFEHTPKYDLIIEQTFLSALHPSMRLDYAKQMHNLLKPNGKLVGVIFGIDLYEDHPPYGGLKPEYEKLFSPYFNIKVLDVAHNSIEPRKGNELFLILEKK
jgi:thiopurine S-methyltransferase